MVIGIERRRLVLFSQKNEGGSSAKPRPAKRVIVNDFEWFGTKRGPPHKNGATFFLRAKFRGGRTRTYLVKTSLKGTEIFGMQGNTQRRAEVEPQVKSALLKIFTDIRNPITFASEEHLKEYAKQSNYLGVRKFREDPAEFVNIPPHEFVITKTRNVLIKTKTGFTTTTPDETHLVLNVANILKE